MPAYVHDLTVLDLKRQKDFIDVFGTNTVPITSPVPVRANAPDVQDGLFYHMDMSRVTREQFQRLVALLSQRFGLAEAEVERDLDEQGLPILADNTVVATQLRLF